uniref:Uncharacterized protein n=1 Tax=Siphoviridae sp. ct6bb17 TaxID=2825345 RepID=A0A8S5NZM9_9CAUD|nr:MAG TPA: hypothetical protein [Siphoviridae sp. ct6bb17]
MILKGNFNGGAISIRRYYQKGEKELMSWQDQTKQ